MRYVLTQYATSTEGLIEITKHDYEELIKCKEILLELLSVEEKFNLVIENYFEFEATIFKIAAQFMIYRNQDYETFQNDRYLVIRRIINLLSASRLYLDHVSHHLSNLDQNDINKIIKFTNKEYDLHFSYRFMEALRNHVQHRGIPFHKLSLNSERVDDSDKIKYSAIPYVDISILMEDKKFKSKIRKELEEMGQEKVNLSIYIRKYIASFGRIHSKIRENTSQLSEKCESIISEKINLFKKKFGDDIVALGIGLENDDRTTSGIVYLFSEFIERKNELIRKNRNLGNLENYFVSSESFE